ncbi:triple tyrosine motif-containing protein [uncultured Muriicola sp.]|uniref:helix-turn-helix and ligand-binding sensor domain-containing protein n=1 Tax=uncultured Muriicola sp. TaxID=1583102 RepID=UPI002638E053|nr:triple tyrosine motif-containing protein [uncultured Muriicola sp.]
MRVIVLLLGFFLSLPSIAQGLPPIQNYAPVDYKAENQNWAISQTSDKIIYVANSKGLLEYNGAQWTLYQSPNESVMRSVKVIDEKIYTGSYMEFGFWEKNNLGILRYISLSENIKEMFIPDEEFWNILDIDNYIVFQSLKRIYIYDLQEDSFNIIESETSLPKIFNLDQGLYFQRLNKGIYKIESGKDVLFLDDEIVRNDEVINIFQSKEELLFLTRHNGIFKLNGSSLEEWNTNTNKLLSTVSVYSGIQLKDKNFAIGTISEGLIQLDESGDLLFYIDQIKGLRNNTVLSLFEDLDGNLWLGLDNGISYINLSSPFKVYVDNRGVAGSVYASEIFNNILYLGTNQGLFYKETNSYQNFRLIDGTQGQVWSLKKIGNSLFCGHHKGTFVIEEDKAKIITDVAGTWKIEALDEHPDLILQGNYDGLYILEKSGNQWRLRNKIRGFDISSRYFESYKNQIFVNHEYKGIFKVQVDSAISEALSVSLDTVLRGSNSGLVKYKEDLYFAYKKGVYKYDRTSEQFTRDSIISGVVTEDDYVSGKMIVDAENKYLWVFSKTRISLISEGSLTRVPLVRSIPLAENVRSGVVGYESVSQLGSNEEYLIGTSTGFISVDIQKITESVFEVYIGSISNATKNDDKNTFNLLDKNIEGEFKSDENYLDFEYHSPVYSKYLKPRYQYQLLGIYGDWSEWSEESIVRFENLPAGNYTFKVRARVGDDISSNIATYSFKISRPWYLSNGMIILYLIAMFIASVAVHKAYKRHYHKRQEKLIEKNKREMALAKARNEKEIVKIKNEQLKEQFQSKSNELAASTLSIIKKNELLDKVKDQLISSADDKETIKPIINIIEKSLKQNDDWEMFKEAFDNADRKFLKNLKKAHPNLSPNDIKLCAYLRLNLSSKEIAPLLNISARSIEIKRYRLRKKMNLSHDDNLVNYILTL